MMHLSTHDQNWLPPPELLMSCSTALLSFSLSSGSRSEVHKNITARQRLSWPESDALVSRHWSTCDPGPWWHNAAAQAGRAGAQATSGDAWSPEIKQKKKNKKNLFALWRKTNQAVCVLYKRTHSNKMNEVILCKIWMVKICVLKNFINFCI